MLIHPWDAASPDEWRGWLDTTAPFGQLVVTNNDPVEHRRAVIERLGARGGVHDAGAAAQQSRRLEERGEWKAGS